jgi:micrococcal nuclease
MERYKAKVLRVIDGDTVEVVYTMEFDFLDFEVTFKSKPRRVRLKGIDTPERNEKGYNEATSFTRKFCLGKDVEIEVFGKDSFGRDLGHVFVNGTNVNDELLARDLARIWVD